MLATVLWIGSLTALAVLVLPVAQRSLDRLAYGQLLVELQQRLEPLGWFCLVVLVATGLFQMSANPNYAGFINFSNRWAIAILLKHILFLGMVAASAYLTWGVLPRLRRIALLQAHGQSPPQDELLQRQNLRLIRLNLILGVFVLALTALARVT
jgi:uncharacterized membrane protein